MTAPAVQPALQPAAQPESVSSTISAGMTVVGKIIGDGAVKIFGRIEGELQASNVTICDGATVEGNVVAQELTIGGRLKGTIHALRVQLQGTAVVEGDIYHRSLSIEENARFEGSSRREDNLADKATAGQVKVENPLPQAQSQAALNDVNGRYNGGPDRLHSV
ncbi:MAG TPA: polymer-forming cytoskeletal protein [Xanthobacteraceae bacterium]|nr:polymer-forming cytoskeletal protein [Xanthobacteraceae bacterium]